METIKIAKNCPKLWCTQKSYNSYDECLTIMTKSNKEGFTQKEEINLYTSLKSYNKVFENFTKTAFKNQAMGRPILGTKESVNNIQKSNLKLFLNSNYTPENMVVSMSGNINKDKFFKIVEEKFSDIKNKLLIYSLKA